MFKFRETLRKNKPERDFEKLARDHGWDVTKRGWPDFFCILPDGSVAAVECKPNNMSLGLKKLKDEQVIVMQALKRAGFKCYLSDGKRLYNFTE